MARNITVTFDDGTTHVYQNAPDDITPDQVQQRAQSDFGKNITALDGGRKSEPAKEEGYLKETVKNALHTQGLAARSAIEGIAGIPEGAYNTASLLANALRGRLPQEGHKNEWGVPDTINTQQYGTAVANKLGLPQADETNPTEKIGMDIGRAVIGGAVGSGVAKALGNMPKLAQILGANNPVRTALGTAAAVGAGDIAQEATKESDDPMVKYGVPMVAGIGANMAVGGTAKAGSYIMNPAERAAGALARQEANLAKAQQRLPDDLTTELTPYNAELYAGTKPTAAMIYRNPAIGSAETMARLRNKEAFFTRDEENARLIAQALRDKAESGNAKTMLNQLNAQTTPLREQAIEQAAQTGGFQQPVAQRVNDLLTQAGTRYEPQIKTLTNPIQQVLESPDVHPLDLYARRKALSDALNNKSPLTMDELTNAAKNQRREATILKQSIDEGLNQASGGKWSDYINTHREGMKPINDVEAWQAVAKRFENKPEIEQGIPRVTPAALRQAISNETFSRDNRDLLLPKSRKEANAMIQTLNAMERAKDARAAINGSQTTPLAMQAMKSMIPEKGKPVASALSMAKNFLTGNTALDDAILNPEKLPALIELAVKNKDETLLNALRNATVRQSLINQQGAQ